MSLCLNSAGVQAKGKAAMAETLKNEKSMTFDLLIQPATTTTSLFVCGMYTIVYKCVGYDSHQVVCEDAGPERHCAESPGLSHCNLLVHGSPPSYPVPVIQPLHKTTHTQSMICRHQPITYTC